MGRPSLWEWAVYRATWLAIAPVILGPFRLKGFGHRQIPRDEPLLLLPNHHTMLDPFMAGWLPVRMCRFMASAQPLKTPFLGAFLKALGAFPKQKFVKDRTSMELLQKQYDAGYLVTVFPEGSRSWNGRTREIGDGIGRLVNRMGARVVLARIVTGHFFWPRWARYPRFVPVHIEYEGPLSWEDTASAAEVTADIQARLTCEQRLPEGALTFGLRMAHGLPSYLWACPSCFELGGLQVHRRNGNKVVCTACRAQWRVHVDTRLEALRAHPGFTVAEAMDRLVEHFGARPVANAARFAEEGVALDAPDSVVLKARDEGPGFESVAAGTLRLTSGGLEADGGWRLGLDEIRAVSVELGNKVQLRSADGLFRLQPGDGAGLRWAHFVHEWRCARKGLPRSPVG